MNRTADKHTLVLGASENPQRYSNMAMRLLKSYGHSVTAIGNKAGESAGIPIQKLSDNLQLGNIHTVTLYLNPLHQKSYYSLLKAIHPQRVIFNPGTENPELESLLEDMGIACEEACTLVLLRSGQY